MRGAFAVGLVAVLAAACSSVVDGRGTSARSAAPSVSRPSGTGFPSSPTSASSTAPAVQNFQCPAIVYPAAKLRFSCFSPNLTASTRNSVWPLVESVRVDSSGWVAETGAGHWGARDGDTLAAIAQSVRDRMVSTGQYGPSPGVETTVVHDARIDGHPANNVTTTITIDPGYRKKIKTKVKIEKLWVIAIEVSFGDVSLWFVSLPDLVRDRWAYVQRYIDSIKVLT